LAGLPELTKLVGLHFEQAGFHGGGAPKSPHTRLSVIVGDNGRFERLVVFCILQRTDDGLGRETVANGVAAGTL
jgi:hypothetical protein